MSENYGVDVWMDKDVWAKHESLFGNVLSNPEDHGDEVYFPDISSHHWASARTLMNEHGIGCEYKDNTEPQPRRRQYVPKS